MKRFASILTGGLLLGGLVFAQDKPSKEQPLPKSIQTLLESCEKEAFKNRCEYEDKNLALFKKCETNLQKELDNILKSNSSTKLEDAVMVKEKISTFKKEISTKMDEKGRENLLADEKKDGKKDEKKSSGSVEKMIVGKWKYDNKIYIFEKDGIMQGPSTEKFSWKYAEESILIFVGVSERLWATMSIKSFNNNKIQATLTNTTSVMVFEKQK